MSPQPALGDRGVVALADALRAAGLAVGTGQVVTCRRAVAVLGRSPEGRYWAGRTTLVTSRADLSTYDRVFRALEDAATDDPALPPPVAAEAGVPAGSDRRTRGRGDHVRAGAVAVPDERLRHRRFDRATDQELAAIGAALRALRVGVPHRTSRRTRPGRRGDLDLGRTLDRALASDGELFDPVWRQRRRRPRRVLLVLDVSGSMAAYARPLLHLAIAVRRSADLEASRRVEVFAFGTRLTRLTDALGARDPDAAIAAAAAEVVDWDGGTRIAASIDRLVRTSGPRGLLQGSVVVICSDGLERGEPADLAAAMARLARSVHHVVWVNPLAGDPRFEPSQRGMAAALDHVDVFLPGHDLASLEDLVDVLTTLR